MLISSRDRSNIFDQRRDLFGAESQYLNKLISMIIKLQQQMHKGLKWDSSPNTFKGVILPRGMLIIHVRSSKFQGREVF